MKFSLILLLLFSVSTFATEVSNEPSAYECQMILADESGEGIQSEFKMAASSGVHGGIEKNFVDGEDDITIVADRKWLAITWRRAGKVVAVGYSVVQNPSNEFRVILLLNPNNLDEQVSLGCGPVSN